MALIVFVLLFVFAFFAFFADYVSVKKQKIFYLFLGLLLIFVAGLRIGDKMPDYQTYIGMYQQIAGGSFSYFIEISFVYIAEFANYIAKGQAGLLIFIYAVIGVSVKLFSIKKLSKLYFFSLVIYISNYYILHEMIQIRAGVATGFVLVAIVPLFERKKLNFFILISLATLFHYSSLIFLLLWFLKPESFKSIYYLLLIPIAYFIHFTKTDPISLILKFLPSDILSAKMDYVDKDRAENLAINVVGVFALTRIIIVLYFTYFQHCIQKQNQYFILLLKCYTLGIFSYIALADYPEIAVRIGYTLMATEIIIIPSLIYTIKGNLIPRFIVIAYAILAFLLNIYFTTYFNWEL